MRLAQLHGVPMTSMLRGSGNSPALGALWNRTRDPKLLEEALQAADAALRLIEKAEAREQLPDAELARDTIFAAMGKGKAGLAAA
jgi:hypothetical protein